MQNESVSVSLVCANSIVSEGLKSILLEENFRISGQHRSCQALIKANEQGATDIGLIVIDVGSSRNIAGEVTAIRDVLKEPRVVVLREELEIDCLVEVFEAGADGYVLKEISCEALVNCLRLAANGEKVVPGNLVEQLPHFTLAAADQGEVEGELSELLSEREIETLRCLVMGYPNKVIARRLDIGEATVKVHVKAILRKLMVQNRTQAAIWAVNHGVQTSIPALADKSPSFSVEDADDAEDVVGESFMLARKSGAARQLAEA